MNESPEKSKEEIPEVKKEIVGTGEKIITIHVVDTHSGATEDFMCNKSLILKEMRYFEKYTMGSPDPKSKMYSQNLEDLDITI